MANNLNKVVINASKFENVVQEGGEIYFSSSDGEEYEVDCANPHCNLSDNLPLTLPSDKTEKKITINSNTSGKTYNLKVTKKNSSPKYDEDLVRPTMIIKVG